MERSPTAPAESARHILFELRGQQRRRPIQPAARRWGSNLAANRSSIGLHAGTVSPSLAANADGQRRDCRRTKCHSPAGKQVALSRFEAARKRANSYNGKKIIAGLMEFRARTFVLIIQREEIDKTPQTSS